MSLVTRLRNALTGFRAEGELIPLSDSRILDIFAIPDSDTGETITPETAMRVAAVYACVSLIAGIGAGLPLRFYSRADAQKGGVREEIPDHPYWWLFNEEPTPAWTAHSMWELSYASTLLRGDGGAGLLRDRAGQVREVIPFHPEQIKVERNEQTRELSYATYDGMNVRGWASEDFLHFHGFGFNGERSMSVLQFAAQRAAGIAISADRFAGRYFRHGISSNIVIESPGRLDQGKIDQLRQLIEQRYSGTANAHKPLVLTQGVTAKELKISNSDAQLLESRKWQVIDIARAFGVPPFLIGETEKTSSWGTGIEQMTLGFVKFTIAPHVRRMEQELNRKLFRTSRSFCAFDFDDLLRGDSKARGEYFRQAMGGSNGPGWMTRNEVRRANNLPPLEGGDEPWEPNQTPDSGKGSNDADETDGGSDGGDSGGASEKSGSGAGDAADGS